MKEETLEETAERIIREWVAEWFGPPPDDMKGVNRDLSNRIISALRNEREGRFKLTEREAQILIEHHNYEAEKAITRTGCRINERYHRDRAAAIRGRME